MSMQFPPPGGSNDFPPPPPAAPTPPPPGAEAPPGYRAYEPHGEANAQPRAGFWARFGGWILDSILYGLLATVLSVPGIALTIGSIDWDCTGEGDTFNCEGSDANVGPLLLGIGLLVAAFLLVAFIYLRALGRTGQTWGRRIVGVKVVGRDTGEPIGFGRALGRQLFASFISGQILYLGYLWMLWDGEKQTWHDKIVNSIVVSA